MVSALSFQLQNALLRAWALLGCGQGTDGWPFPKPEGRYNSNQIVIGRTLDAWELPGFDRFRELCRRSGFGFRV